MDLNNFYDIQETDLAIEYGTDIGEPCSMMHHNGNEVDSENHFLAGCFFKADTPVPDGYDYYDVPTESAAYAIYVSLFIEFWVKEKSSRFWLPLSERDYYVLSVL
jgi:hypothetical protein